MTAIQQMQDLQEQIARARDDVAYFLREQATLRHTLAEAEGELAIAVRRCMVESGLTNETARRAYAEQQTDERRAEVSEIAFDLVKAERALITAQTALAIALDRRRVLEAQVRLMVNAADSWMTDAYATEDANELAF